MGEILLSEIMGVKVDRRHVDRRHWSSLLTVVTVVTLTVVVLASCQFEGKGFSGVHGFSIPPKRPGPVMQSELHR